MYTSGFVERFIAGDKRILCVRMVAQLYASIGEIAAQTVDNLFLCPNKYVVSTSFNNSFINVDVCTVKTPDYPPRSGPKLFGG